MSDFQPSGPEFVFRVVHSISELNANRGQDLVWTPDDPVSAIQVVSHLPSSYEAYLLKHFSRLHQIGQYPSALPFSAYGLLVRRMTLRDSA